MGKTRHALEAVRLRFSAQEAEGARGKWRLGERPRFAAALLTRFGTVLEREQQRWFLWSPVAFGLGIALYFWLPGEPSLIGAMVPLVGALILAWLARAGGTIRFLTGALVALSAGMGIAKVRTESLRAPVLTTQLRNVQLQGWLVLAEPKPNGGQRLTVHVLALGNLARERLPRRVRVSTKRANQALIPGDLITLKATIGPPGTPVMPGGYDFARHAWFQQIGGIGYGRAAAVSIPPDKRQSPAGTPLVAPLHLRVSAAIQRLRQRLGRRIMKALPGETGAIANALITGERASISDETNEAFRDSGLFHILSISGLHMVIMAGAIFYVLRLLLAAFPAIALRYGIKKWGAAAAALGALAYLAISGGTFATVRSYIMISIMFFAILLDRPAVALRNVALAALVILLLYPESLLNVGFQMSFAAVVSLVAAYEALRDRAAARPNRESHGPIMGFFVFFGGIIMTTLVASISVAPLAAYHFHTSQHYAVLANLIAVPICNIIVMPAALATFLAMPFGLEALPLWIMGKGIEGMVWCAKAVAQLPGAVGLLPQIPKLAFLAMVGGGLWLTLWRRRWRLLGMLGILAGLMLAPGKLRPDILIGEDGALVALRLPRPVTVSGGLAGRAPNSNQSAMQTQLSALPNWRGRYQLERWLRADGDGRNAKKVANGAGFACDRDGCTARVKGKLVAIPRHISALRDDCVFADIIIAKFNVPKWCAEMRLNARKLNGSKRVARPDAARPDGVSAEAAGPEAAGPEAAGTEQKGAPGPSAAYDPITAFANGPARHDASASDAADDGVLIIDRGQLRARGPHALYIETEKGARGLIVTDWVAAHRGVRPWSMPPELVAKPATKEVKSAAKNRL